MFREQNYPSAPGRGGQEKSRPPCLPPQSHQTPHERLDLWTGADLTGQCHMASRVPSIQMGKLKFEDCVPLRASVPSSGE